MCFLRTLIASKSYYNGLVYLSTEIGRCTINRHSDFTLASVPVSMCTVAGRPREGGCDWCTSCPVGCDWLSRRQYGFQIKRVSRVLLSKQSIVACLRVGLKKSSCNLRVACLRRMKSAQGTNRIPRDTSFYLYLVHI